MKTEDLKEAGCIYFPRIQEGFERYRWETVRLSAGEAIEHFRRLCEKAGEENSFLDFYYFAVTEEERKRLEPYLTREEKEFLAGYRETHPGEEWKKSLVFPLTPAFLSIAVKLNAAQALFSTFYFGGAQKSTWWGNYGEEYVRFWGEEKKSDGKGELFSEDR